MKRLYPIFFILIIITLSASLALSYLASPKDYPNSVVTQWQSTSKTVPLSSGQSNTDIEPISNSFHALHADTHNSDELAIAASRSVNHLWTVESDMFIAEGPTEDNQGNLYFSPIDPKENLLLVSLDGKTGDRRWSVPMPTAQSEVSSHGGGAPLILNDPDHTGKQLIYLSVYETAVAMTQEGELLWQVTPPLAEYSIIDGSADDRHVFGLNYHPQMDALVGLTASGHLFMLDRKTGRSLLDEAYSLPGEAAMSQVSGRPPEWLARRVDDVLDQVFGSSPNNVGRFTTIVNALFGDGGEVSNFFSIDKNSGRMFVAASAPDAIDGHFDQRSEFGALYALDAVRDSNGQVAVVEVARRDFAGGSGATPALSADGLRVYTADNDNQVLAFDRDLNPIWSFDVGQTIAASISVSSENNELYAVSMQKIFKLYDRGDRAEIAWQASLDVFPEILGYQNINMTTPTIVANGIAVTVGAGFANDGFTLPFAMGVGLLDRENGAMLAYSPAREESVSVTAVASDGGYYLANSPIRRAVTRAIFGGLVAPLTGGISRYGVDDDSILVADIICAREERKRALARVTDEAQKSGYLRHIDILNEQLSGWIPADSEAAQSLSSDHCAVNIEQ